MSDRLTFMKINELQLSLCYFCFENVKEWRHLRTKPN